MAIDVDGLPDARRDNFGELVALLADLAGDNLLGCCAFGGWVVDDPAYKDLPARSVLVLREVDLDLLDALAGYGGRFGRQGLAAPLIMTPEYIAASTDVFPLELLEMQQLHRRVCGKDYFSDLVFKPGELRLQCERELKSELIQLRQGLISAAGKRQVLPALCLSAAERCSRVLRGVLHLAGRRPPEVAVQLLAQGGDVTGTRLEKLRAVLAGVDRFELDDFKQCYREVADLAAHVDTHAG
jgi:hypothetical protein